GTREVEVLVVALVGFGFCKGLYDANIWASLYDVVPVGRRATAQGVMNAIGWLGAGTAPVAIAAASKEDGMGGCLSATSVIYLAFGGLMLAGSVLLMRGGSSAPGGRKSIAPGASPGSPS